MTPENQTYFDKILSLYVDHPYYFWIIIGLIVLKISQYLVVKFRNKRKAEKKDLIPDNIKQKTIDPIVYDLFNKIVDEKLKFYLTQLQSRIDSMNEADIKANTELFVKDVLSTFDTTFLSYLFSIYKEETIEVIIRQKFLNTFYYMDKKLNEDLLNLPEEVISD